MNDKEKSVFEKLKAIDFQSKVKSKNGLSYLTWTDAWSEVKLNYPDATYKVREFQQPNGTSLPYQYDPNTGYMVWTTVQIEDISYDMWLPVMDSSNHAMKSKSYSIKTKNKDIFVKEASMFDINKTIMRALVKNLAMFGLGIYIYAGEDLPDLSITEQQQLQQEYQEQKDKQIFDILIKRAKNDYEATDEMVEKWSNMKPTEAIADMEKYVAAFKGSQKIEE